MGVQLDAPETDSMKIRSVLGVGASGRVYDVEYQAKQAVMKAYNRESEKKQEAKILRILEPEKAFIPRVLRETTNQLVMQPVGLPLGVRTPLTYTHIVQFIETVSMLHNVGVLHCDVRPDNLVLYMPLRQVWEPNVEKSIDVSVDGLEITPRAPRTPRKFQYVPVRSPMRQEISSPTFEYGLYLIDYAFAVQLEEIKEGICRPFVGTVKFASDEVLAQLSGAKSKVHYAPMDEWHCVIRTLYALSHPLMWQHISNLPKSDFEGVRSAWQCCLLGQWNVSHLQTSKDMKDRALELARQSFVNFKAVSIY